MLTDNLDNMKGGWFVGDFSPSILQTKDCEVAIQKYPAGKIEQFHYHKISTEITVIISGEVLMNDIKYTAGDIILLQPGEGTDFKTVTDVVTAVVKLPSSTNDKYFDRS